jgi:anti-sigma regulatory factor (Ser/Thr protein kinase)
MGALAKAEVRQWLFEGAELNDINLIDRLVNSICTEFSVAASRRADLELLICEVIANSIDHGILGLDSRMKKDPQGFEQYFVSRAAQLANLTKGYISVCAEQISPHRIRLSVEDSGAGFHYPQKDNGQSADCLMLAYGRGLLIIRNLCHSMTHIGNGNCIVVEIDTA